MIYNSNVSFTSITSKEELFIGMEELVDWLHNYVYKYLFKYNLNTASVLSHIHIACVCYF